MADTPATPSGSRWEPDPDEIPTSESPAAAPPAPPLDDPAAEERRAQLRSRAVLAGAATALVFGGGLTGFVIGHATADDGGTGIRPANFSQQDDDGRQGPPSFDDGDGDGGLPPGQGPDGNGSSSNSGTGT
jgi:hypothetical protein